MDRVLLIGAAVATGLAQRAHAGAVEALPEHDRDVMYVLLRGQIVALVLILAIVPIELLRMRLASGSALAAALPALVGLFATILLWFVRRRAHRVYELATDDDAQVERARGLQRHALHAFVAGAVVWTGLLVYKIV